MAVVSYTALHVFYTWYMPCDINDYSSLISLGKKRPTHVKFCGHRQSWVKVEILFTNASLFGGILPTLSGRKSPLHHFIRMGFSRLPGEIVQEHVEQPFHCWRRRSCLQLVLVPKSWWRKQWKFESSRHSCTCWIVREFVKTVHSDIAVLRSSMHPTFWSWLSSVRLLLLHMSKGFDFI